MRRVAGVELHHGRVAVAEQVIGFQRKAIADGSVIDATPLELPETSFETEGVWFCPAGELLDGIDEMPTLVSALHAAEHSLISLLPLFAMCDRWDIGGLSTNVHEQTGRPTIFVYEGHAGGVGITERGFDCFDGVGRGHGAAARPLPVPGGMPFVRAEPEVRQPQRAARQGSRTNAARADDARARLRRPRACGGHREDSGGTTRREPAHTRHAFGTDTARVSCDRSFRGSRSPHGGPWTGAAEGRVDSGRGRSS